MTKKTYLVQGLTLAGLVCAGSVYADGEPNAAYDRWDISFSKVEGKAAAGKYWNGSSYSSFKAMVGRFTMDPTESYTKGSTTYADKNFYSYCTDIGAVLASNWDYDPVPFNGQDGVYPQWRANGIYDAAYIYNQSFSGAWSVNTDSEYSGMQLAIWELLYDAPGDSSNNYGLTDASSHFSVQTYDAAALASAKNYLQWLLDAKNNQTFQKYENTWLRPINNSGLEGGSQGLLMQATSVPDVGSTFSLLAASSVGLVFLGRRNKKA